MKVQDSILIVDDNPPFRHLLAAILKRSGFNPVESEDGQQALEMLPDVKPKAVMLDLHMKNLGGIAFMEEYKHRGYTMPVVLITADTAEDIAERYAHLGFVEVLKKPISQNQIVDLLNKAL